MSGLSRYDYPGWVGDALIFLGVIGGLVVLRVIAATWIFLWLLPDGTRCPHCDHDTLPVVSRGWNTLLPWFRTGWCPGCGWEGLHRRSGAAPVPSPLRRGEHL